MVSYQANFLASLAAAVEGETEASLLRRANAGDGEAMLLLADCYQFEARAVVGNSNRQHNVMASGPTRRAVPMTTPLQGEPSSQGRI